MRTNVTNKNFVSEQNSRIVNIFVILLPESREEDDGNVMKPANSWFIIANEKLKNTKLMYYLWVVPHGEG